MALGSSSIEQFKARVDRIDWSRCQRLEEQFKYWSGNSAWEGHLPFAKDLVKAKAPELVVELGSHYGDSFFSFCQSVSENQLATRCVAIDTWEGDHQTGFYGDEIYQQVVAENVRYQSFSTLMRMTFDDAVKQFEDKSIDILHIDGLHTYEAVSHDFATWLCKIRPGGIVLFHDTVIVRDDFGVYKFWDEISSQYQDTYNFEHSCGLGVLRVPTDSPEQQYTWLENLLFNEPGAADWLREHYASLTANCRLQDLMLNAGFVEGFNEILHDAKMFHVVNDSPAGRFAKWLEKLFIFRLFIKLRSA
ncbi:MAG: class I SAM-dependent methyltransferase [Coxiellaceae bacterium]|nr:class I SAM-dependent methyltransferase [Coxiellaceae bacterium]